LVLFEKKISIDVEILKKNYCFVKILIFKILENKGQRFKVKFIRIIVGCIKEVKGN
jgi:hypothetical protein